MAHGTRMQRLFLLVLCGCLVVACSSSERTLLPWDGSVRLGHGDDAGEDDAGEADGSVVDGRVTQPAVCTQCGGCEEALAVNSANHVVGTVSYPDRPPVGGDHNECWGSWGVHAKPLAPERWVHNLEHGGVVLLYHCPNGCTAEVSELAKFMKGRAQTLLTAYTDMPTRFAVVAWGHRLKSDCLDLAAWAQFYGTYVDHAPESIPSGPPTGCPP